ncbi:MAG: hypothetical protein M3Y44_07525, partial [Actinomycetota bacterium]|nr:hypothetical protein [Actinomycetota bacterium]
MLAETQFGNPVLKERAQAAMSKPASTSRARSRSSGAVNRRANASTSTKSRAAARSNKRDYLAAGQLVRCEGR